MVLLVIRPTRLAARLECFFHPGASPDLNPIEDVWAYIKGQLYNKERYPHKPKNVDELRSRVQHLWNSIDPVYIKKIASAMARRRERV
jgi:transposase